MPPLELARDRAVYGEIAGHRNWGSAVVALDPAVSIEPLRVGPHPVVPAAASCSPTRTRVRGDRPPGRAGDPADHARVRLRRPGRLALVSTVLRVVADLVPLFDSPHGARVILGGDLNVSSSTRTRGRPRPRGGRVRGDPRARARRGEDARPAAAGIAAGLPLRRGRGCKHLATWANVELDHLFVSPALAGPADGALAGHSAVEAGLSDHVPIVLDLALSAERTPQAWDEESFAEEIGRRHGPAARDVIEKLANWADRKERELASVVGVRTKTLTRFPTNGSTTEPELCSHVDLDARAARSQYALDPRRRPGIVVQFGNMRHPPFDTDAARNELRRALNEMDGVDIRRARSTAGRRSRSRASRTRRTSFASSPSSTGSRPRATRPRQPMPSGLRRTTPQRRQSPGREDPVEGTDTVDDGEILKRRFIGMVEVDSGTLLLGDPLYCLPRAKDGTPGIDYASVIAAPDEPASYLGGKPVCSWGSSAATGPSRCSPRSTRTASWSG